MIGKIIKFIIALALAWLVISHWSKRKNEPLALSRAQRVAGLTSEGAMSKPQIVLKDRSQLALDATK